VVKVDAARSWVGPITALGAFGLYSLGDASIRGIGHAVPPFELAFFAAAISLAISPVVLGRSARWEDLIRPNRWWRWWARGGLAIGGTVLGINAWANLPLAEAAAILFLGPLLTSAFTPLVLREKVPASDWFALVAGFIGVIIVLRPGLRQLQWAHFAALGCAVCSSAAGLLLRYTEDRETAATMYGASAIGVCLVGGGATLSHFVIPPPATLGFLLAFTGCGAFANVFLMYAWRKGPVSAVATAQYSQIIWGVLLGYFFFAEIPDLATRIGAALIFLSGVCPFLLRRRVLQHSEAGNAVRTRDE